MDVCIIFIKLVSELSLGEAAYFLSRFLKNGFLLLPLVVGICFWDWQFLLFLSSLELLLKLNISHQQPVGVKLLHLCSSFPHSRLDIELDFGLNQPVVWVAVHSGHDSGV